jgi:CRP-like cAMP-binding protein
MPQISRSNFVDSMMIFLRRDSRVVRTLRLPRHAHVYTTGDRDQRLYFVESGEVKIILPSATGRDFLLDVIGPAGVFGESCFTSRRERIESAITREKTILKTIAYSDMLPLLRQHSLYEPLVRHLTYRIDDLETRIADMATLNSEMILAKALLRLARDEEHGGGIVQLRHRISQEELAQIAGTTRPRVTRFMRRFRTLGLVEWDTDRLLTVHVDRIGQFLEKE